MSEVDWSEAPEGAEFYAADYFYRTDKRDILQVWYPSAKKWKKWKIRPEHKIFEFLSQLSNYSERPSMAGIDWAKAPDWAVDVRVGGTGRKRFTNGIDKFYDEDLHEVFSMTFVSHDWPVYELRPKEWPTDDRINAIAQNGGDGLHYAAAKHDTDKPCYDLLPPVAIDLMAQVMTFGAKKYKPEGWRTVPDAIQRYQAALLRHSFAMLRGEALDEESGLPHAAHAMCCAAFIAELQREGL